MVPHRGHREIDFFTVECTRRRCLASGYTGLKVLLLASNDAPHASPQVVRAFKSAFIGFVEYVESLFHSEEDLVQLCTGLVFKLVSFFHVWKYGYLDNLQPLHMSDELLRSLSDDSYHRLLRLDEPCWCNATFNFGTPHKLLLDLNNARFSLDPGIKPDESSQDPYEKEEMRSYDIASPIKQNLERKQSGTTRQTMSTFTTGYVHSEIASHWNKQVAKTRRKRKYSDAFATHFDAGGMRLYRASEHLEAPPIDGLSGSGSLPTNDSTKRPRVEWVSARAVPRQYCEICMEDLPEVQFPIGKISKLCNHSAKSCLDCISQSLASQLDYKAWDRLACPACPAVLECSEVERFSSPNTITLY
ncbi:hypothetical protein MMC11_001038 [Xylographa trunciseda]|nr:hypothetical protein [Xylographa trunciseda]